MNDVRDDIATVANTAVKGAAEIGADVSLVARRTVDESIETSKEVGANAEEVSKVVVEGQSVGGASFSSYWA